MSNLQTIGTALAVLAGFFVGSSTVLQKKGILVTKDLAEATGAKRAYMKSLYWWMGMLCLALGEVCNFVAYALTPAIIVAPLMAVSVVVSSIMAVIVLKEKLNFTASAGIILCLLGAVIIVLHGPMTQTVANLTEFTKFIIAPGFLAYTGVLWAINIYLVFRLGPKYGHIHPAIYLTITAIGSAYLIAASQGFGIAIVYSIEHWSTDNELLKWEFYVLAVFVVFVCVFQIDYLNRALKYFSASIVTPLNFVFMSTTTLVTTSVLYQGFQVGSAVTAVTILIGFLVIVLGVVLLLQYNLKLTKRDTMKERSIEDRLFRELDYDIQNDNPFSMLNKAYSIQSSRIEPFGESQIELPIVIDQDKRHLRKRSNASSVSNTPSDPAFGHDKPQPDDDGGSI